MQQLERDWIVYLDDTIRRIDQVAPATPLLLGNSGVLGNATCGYSEEITVQNNSSEVIYVVRGSEPTVTPVLPLPQGLDDIIIGTPCAVVVSIREHTKDPRNPKKADKNEAIQHTIDFKTLYSNPIYIPQTGAFICTGEFLSRVKTISSARYNAIAPDASSQVWIYAHQTRRIHTELYASVNNQIVRIKVRTGPTEHVIDRAIYYQSLYQETIPDSHLIDTIPMDHFDEHTVWKTKYGEYISTSYEELKLLLSDRGIDIGYAQSLEEQLQESKRMVAHLKKMLKESMTPEVKQFLLDEKRTEQRWKHFTRLQSVSDWFMGIVKQGTDTYDKYHHAKRKREEAMAPSLRKVFDIGSELLRYVPLLTGVVKFVAKRFAR